jgi:hypothetical protein
MSLSRSNFTTEHPLTANCLRKCALWNLNMKDAQKERKYLQVDMSRNSGVALKQMNYEVAKNLSKE